MPKINGLITKEEREKRIQERYKYIVKLKDECGLNFTVIGQRLDMSPRGVGRIYNRMKNAESTKK